MTKYYRVKKDTFLWLKDCILKHSDSCGGDMGGYQPISDIWDVVEDKKNVQDEYISAVFIENNPEWFERVYPVDLLTKTVYKLKAEALQAAKDGFKKK